MLSGIKIHRVLIGGDGSVKPFPKWDSCTCWMRNRGYGISFGFVSQAGYRTSLKDAVSAGSSGVLWGSILI